MYLAVTPGLREAAATVAAASGADKRKGASPTLAADVAGKSALVQHHERERRGDREREGRSGFRLGNLPRGIQHTFRKDCA